MEIVPNDEARTVPIDGQTIEAWPCNESLHDRLQSVFYYDKYDALFCPDCNVWLERACRDSLCPYCSGRPERPLPVPLQPRGSVNVAGDASSPALGIATSLLSISTH